VFLSQPIRDHHPFLCTQISHQQFTLKALLVLLIPLSLLTGCGSLTNALKAFNSSDAQLQQSKAVRPKPVDKAHGPKQAATKGVDSIPPLAESKSIPTKPQDKLSSPPSKILKLGSRGQAVWSLENRLNELRYDMGAIDGFYDQQTRQGVMAFQKYARLKRTGTYTQETQAALSNAMLPVGLHPELGLPRIEIDLTRQVLLFFDEQGLNRIVSVSTGSNRRYCETSKKSKKRICGLALTPRGKFRIQWRVSGWRKSDLGMLYNPLYFVNGFAIHGSPFVPAYNVSHGCVRISLESSIWFYNSVKDGTPVILFD